MLRKAHLEKQFMGIQLQHSSEKVVIIKLLHEQIHTKSNIFCLCLEIRDTSSLSHSLPIANILAKLSGHVLQIANLLAKLVK